MVSPDQLIEWKLKYKRVFCSTVAGKEYIFRPLNRAEIKKVLLLGDAGCDVNEEAVKTAVLWPSPVDVESLAGVADTLGPIILEQSGVGNENLALSIYQQHKESMAQFENWATAFIKYVFPTMTWEELDSMSIDDLMMYLAKATWVAEEILGIKDIINVAQPQPKPEPSEKTEEQVIAEKRKFAEEMRKHGLDPVMLAEPTEEPYMPHPFGGGRFWNRSDVVDAIGREIRKGLQVLADRGAP